MNIAVSVGDVLGPPSEAPPRVRVWVLLGAGAGDNAQLLRLAEALGWPFEAKRIRYNRLNRCPNLLKVRLANGISRHCNWRPVRLAGEIGSAEVARHHHRRDDHNDHYDDENFN